MGEPGQPPPLRRRWSSYRRRILVQAHKSMTRPPEFHTRRSRRGRLVVWWTCPHCGARLGKRAVTCPQWDLGVGDEGCLMVAEAQQRGALASTYVPQDPSAEATGDHSPAVCVLAARASGRRPRCPTCNRALALIWS